MSPKKKPKVSTAALPKSGGERQPKAILQPEGNDRKLVFSFQFADRAYDGKWWWPRAGSAEAAEILDFLCEASRCTWGEMMAQMTGGNHKRRKRHHAQATDTLCPAARNRTGHQRDV